jgi:hypothetical protein
MPRKILHSRLVAEDAAAGRMPSTSISVLLPMPGAPVMPRRSALPVFGNRLRSKASARTRSSSRRLSTNVIARASAWRSPLWIAFASDAIEVTGKGG